MQLTVNGEPRTFERPLTVEQLLARMGMDGRKVAVERNREVVPKSRYGATALGPGDRIEIVHFIGGGAPAAASESSREGTPSGVTRRSEIEGDGDPVVRPPAGGTAATAKAAVGQEEDTWEVAGRRFRSRLIVGTGKYKDYETNRLALEASGAEIVTVALRRVNLDDPNKPMLTDFIDPRKYTYLPNTAGCYTAEDALRTLRLAREAGGWDLVKLEILGDPKTLYPRMIETLEATQVLVREGFQVMVYCNDDPIMAKRLEEVGAAAIMPLGAPIGSGLGIQNKVNIRLIVEQAKVPVLVDAGVGTASDASVAMELGCDGVLMNSAIAEAKDPVRMARAMGHAVAAGRLAYLAGRMPKKLYADPSSPLAGLI